MANREMQKKVKEENAKKQARKSVLTKTLIIVLIVVAVSSAVLLPILLPNKEKDANEGKSNGSVALDYEVLNLGSTVTCQPCQMIKPVVDGLKTKYSGVIQFTSHDIQYSTKGASYALKYNVVSMPTLIFLYKGNEVYRTEGYKTAAQIEAVLSTLGWT